MFAATCKLSPGIAPLGFDHLDRALLREFLREPASVALAMRVVEWVARYAPPQPHTFIRYADGSVCTILHESARSSTDPRMVDIWLVGGRTMKTSADDGLRSSSAPQTATETQTAILCRKFGIPVDRAHIVGHSEVPGATHTDPGPAFPWEAFMAAADQTT